jgi:uncharacterized protein (TIGR00251 family)
MVKPTKDGLQINVRLTPKASRDAIQGWIWDAEGHPVLKVGVTAVPEKGKANEALIALLAKSWKLPKGGIVLVRGDTDRNKTLILLDLSKLPEKAPPLSPR